MKYNPHVWEHVDDDGHGREWHKIRPDLTAAKMGLAEEHGHRLTFVPPPPDAQNWQLSRAMFDCSCGQKGMQLNPRVDGKANGHALRHWEEHLMLAHCDPDECHLIGTISRPRGEQKVIVVPRTWTRISEFDGKRLQDAIKHDWYKFFVLGESDKTKALISGAQSRQVALEKATQHLIKAERAGLTVTRLHEGLILEEPPTVQGAVAQLITDGQNAVTLTDVEITMQRIDEVLAIVPGLELMQAGLRQRRIELLTDSTRRLT